MPRVAQPRKPKWTDNLTDEDRGYFGHVKRSPQEFYDRNGIREAYSVFVVRRKSTKFKPNRGKVIGRQYLAKGKPVRSSRNATHVQYEVRINPRQELMRIASKSIGIRPGFTPPGFRTSPPRQEILGFQGLEDLPQTYEEGDIPDDHFEQMEKALAYAEAQMPRPELIHPIGD